MQYMQQCSSTVCDSISSIISWILDWTLFVQIQIQQKQRCHRTVFFTGVDMSQITDPCFYSDPIFILPRYPVQSERANHIEHYRQQDCLLSHVDISWTLILPRSHKTQQTIFCCLVSTITFVICYVCSCDAAGIWDGITKKLEELKS
jgi:hypothetical protein